MKGLIEIRTYHNYFGREYHCAFVEKDSPAQKAAEACLIFLRKEFGNEVYGDRGDELRWERFLEEISSFRNENKIKLHIQKGGEK